MTAFKVVVANIDELRARKGLSNDELAARLGVTRATLYQLKGGYKLAIRLEMLARLCEILDCEPGDILVLVPDDSDEPASESAT